MYRTGSGPQGPGAILAEYAVEDIIVEDPPLEDVIADVFAKANAAYKAEQEAEVKTA